MAQPTNTWTLTSTNDSFIMTTTETSSYHFDNATTNDTSILPVIYTATDTTSVVFSIYTALRFLQGLISCVGNTLTIAAIVKYPTMRTNANIFVAQLAVADLLSSLGPLFELLTSYFEHDHRLWSIFCDIRVIFVAITTQVNSLFVVVISIDRLVYIKFPLRYSSWMTKWPMVAIIAPIWALNLYSIISSPFVKGSPWVTFCDIPFLSNPCPCSFVGAMFALSAAVLIVVNAIIAAIARRQQREIARLTLINVQPLPLPAEAGGKKDKSKEIKKSNNKGKVSTNDLKVIKMLMLVLGIYIACYIPWIVLMTFQPAFHYGPMTYRKYAYVTSVILWLNACANPLIYTWRDRKFRRAFLRLLGLTLLASRVGVTDDATAGGYSSTTKSRVSHVDMSTVD